MASEVQYSRPPREVEWSLPVCQLPVAWPSLACVLCNKSPTDFCHLVQGWPPCCEIACVA